MGLETYKATAILQLPLHPTLGLIKLVLWVCLCVHMHAVVRGDVPGVPGMEVGYQAWRQVPLSAHWAILPAPHSSFKLMCAKYIFVYSALGPKNQQWNFCLLVSHKIFTACFSPTNIKRTIGNLGIKALLLAIFELIQTSKMEETSHIALDRCAAWRTNEVELACWSWWRKQVCVQLWPGTWSGGPLRYVGDWRPHLHEGVGMGWRR